MFGHIVRMKYSFGANDDYAWPLAVMIASLKASEPDASLNLGFMSGRLSGSALDLLGAVSQRDGSQLEIFEFDEDQSQVTANLEASHLSVDTFLKFYMADSIADEHVWVDSDMLVVSGLSKDLPDLLGHSIGMVRAGKVSGLPEERDRDPRATFNSGLIFWGTQKRLDWRRYLTQISTPLLWADQEVFNLLYRNDIMELEPRLNASGQGERNVIDAKVIHFLGNHKPWHLHGASRNLCFTAGCMFSDWFTKEDALVSWLEKYAIGIEWRELRLQSRKASSAKLRALSRLSSNTFILPFMPHNPRVHPLIHKRHRPLR